MPDGNLGHPLGKRIGERGNEGRLLVAFDHGVNDVPSIRAQHASVVVHRNADDRRGQLVMKLRCDAPKRLVLTLLAPATDYIVTVVDRLYQPRNFLGRILQVGIESDDNVTLGLLESREYRRMLAEVARQLDNANMP